MPSISSIKRELIPSLANQSQKEISGYHALIFLLNSERYWLGNNRRYRRTVETKMMR